MAGSLPDRYERQCTRVTPVPGTFLVVPSFLRHRTIPSGAEDERSSIAFGPYPKAGYRDAPDA